MCLLPVPKWSISDYYMFNIIFPQPHSFSLLISSSLGASSLTSSGRRISYLHPLSSMVLLLPAGSFYLEVNDLKTELVFSPPNQVVTEILPSVFVILSIGPQSHFSFLFACTPHLIIYGYANFKSPSSAGHGLQFLKHVGNQPHGLTCTFKT